MQLHNNSAVIAAAGSRKTQHIVDCVLADPTKRVLVTTYTNENLRQLQHRLSAGTGTVPTNIDLMGWFSFLIKHCARPYQSAILDQVGVIEGLNFKGKRSKYQARTDARRFYLDRSYAMYRDTVSDFAVRADEASGGLVIKRLSAIYDHIYVDEVQDMAGYDLDLLELLMDSPIGLTMVGDPRQGTYVTNTSARNKKYKNKGIADWFSDLSERCAIEHRTVSYRCNQAICDFADALYPGLPRTSSENHEVTGHDGIFPINATEARAYAAEYSPKVLRYQQKSDTLGLEAMNIGVSKGSTFDRVLIFPTSPMLEYLKSRNPDKAGDRSKLYVAVTRAKYSVAFVVG
jgi:DNA helicase II / ATP-dependent DNA helicase PcrA